MMKHILYIATFCIITFLFVSCANIVPPSGGPQDFDPPKLDQESSLPNASTNTNYTRNYIELKFNERVHVQNYQNEIYTTPSLDINKFKVSSNKNNVKLEFNQQLEPNTTYTINFGKSIRDITENNPAENIQIAFSTGPIIDSLSVTGKVIDHLTNLPSIKTLVGLYPTSDTAKLFSTKPKYFTQTASDGSFAFNYIKSDEYELIAFTDLNKNFSYERTLEKIGFLSQPIQLDSINSGNELRLIQEPDTVFKIQSIYPRDNYLQVKLNKGYQEDNTNYPPQLLKVTKANNLFYLFDTGSSNDSLTLSFSFTDSLGTTIDSVNNVLINRDNHHLNELLETFYFDRDQDTSYLTLEFHEPVNLINDSIQFFRLKDSTFLASRNAVLKWSNNKSKLQVFHPSFIKDTIEVQLIDSLFTSITNTVSKSEKITFLPFNPENFGIIEGKIISEKKIFELQLIDNQYNVIKKHQNKPIYKLLEIAPGKYSFRILVDDNYDGYIEPGNFSKRIEPESIYFHKETLDVKANWEFLDINIEF